MNVHSKLWLKLRAEIWRKRTETVEQEECTQQGTDLNHRHSENGTEDYKNKLVDCNISGMNYSADVGGSEG